MTREQKIEKLNAAALAHAKAQLELDIAHKNIEKLREAVNASRREITRWHDEIVDDASAR